MVKRLVLLCCVPLLLSGCPKPTPSPSPSPSPTVEPTPEPTPTPCVPPPDEVGWDPVDARPTQHKQAVRDAQEFIGDVCSQAPEASLERLGSRLRLMGYCAGRNDDAVFFQRDDDDELWEEHHAVYYGNGCWLSNTYRGMWRHR